jgi:ubiquinone/menaquinone biosynthesis C-methylase UbiE
MASPDYGAYLHGDVALERKYIIRNRLVELAEMRKPCDVLDVGCGRGLVAIAFALNSPRHKVYAMDVWNQDEIAGNSPEWVLKNAKLEGVSNVTAGQGDARNIPFRAEAFDVVVSNLVIHNLPIDDQLQAFSEMKRVLRPGGLLLYSDVDENGQFNRVREFLLALEFQGTRFYRILTFPKEPPVSVCALVAIKPSET